MRANVIYAAAGVCVGVSVGVAQERPPLELLETSISVRPVRVAPCAMERGSVVRLGDWIPYAGAQRGPVDVRVFDCYGDADSDGVPDEGLSGCGMDDARWYFGTAYCNPFVTNDMYSIDANEAVGYGRSDFAWYWSCDEPEQCLVAVFTQESDPRECEPDSFEYEGWLIDFGVLECRPAGYYYSNVDISSFGVWPAVQGGCGSYVLRFLTDSGSALATCAQPMLWGVPNNSEGWPGLQDPEQLDDDNPMDGTHDTVSECYTYTFGVCPDPLGAMLQFWGELPFDECDYADCDDDGVVNVQDFLCFLNLWVQRDPAADCDGCGIVDTRDFTCFLRQWLDCR